MNHLQQRISQLNTQVLQDSLFLLNKEYSEEADIVMEACLDELMKRMSEEDFVKLCRKLEES